MKFKVAESELSFFAEMQHYVCWEIQLRVPTVYPAIKGIKYFKERELFSSTYCWLYSFALFTGEKRVLAEFSF